MRFIGKFITFMICGLIFIVIIAILVGLGQCKHEETMEVYSFQFDTSTAYSYHRPKCKECGELLDYSNFKGTPNDTSYLELIKANSDGSEIVPGEYYTVKAVVTVGDTSSVDKRIRVACKLENEEYLLGFSVEFREEFKERVELLEKGDEITFRGRFYDEGCGFTDAELIIK